MQAIEYAKQKFSESFLFPKTLSTANGLQLNAKVVDGKLELDGKETAWHKDLNDEQKEAVAVALRGECRPLPLIIFGPPVSENPCNIVRVCTISQSARNSISTKIRSKINFAGHWKNIHINRNNFASVHESAGQQNFDRDPIQSCCKCGCNSLGRMQFEH